jgi:transketolase
MRRIFAQEIVKAAKANPKITVLTGDFGYKLFGELENNPKQYINCGCAEQSMVGVAAGLAIGGYVPVVITITPFLIERAFEQLRLDIGEQKLKVICAGYADYPNAGPTHQDHTCSTLASQLPNFKFYSPRFEYVCIANVAEALAIDGPSIFQLKKL